MRLKLFQAPTVAAALARVRAELGPDALILTTRYLDDGVEMTAAVEPPAPPPPPARPPPPAAWHGIRPALAASLAAGGMEGALRFGALNFAPGSAPLLLVGPPGAGKTLTTARLATRLVLAGQKPMVVTADGKRAGAAEQLAAFTRLLGLTLIVANEPVQLARALARRQEGAPVLIDTPGFDASGAAELALLAAASCAQTALVLPAGLDPDEAEELAATGAGAGATMLVATRLDLCRRLGGILAAAASGLAMVEAGIGPGAADGLCPLTPAFLAARLAEPPVRKAA